MHFLRHSLILILLATRVVFADQTPSTTSPQATVSELATRLLTEYPGKELMMIEVVYPPGAVDPVHRHDAHALVYVLEGSIMMGLRGGKTVTLNPGQTFYEGPDDVHSVGRNASLNEPARFIVVLLKNSADPVLTPIN